jgi:hypothetical protein
VCGSISHVQRVDAGQYHCRLSLGDTTVESPAVLIQVEGETRQAPKPTPTTSRWWIELTNWSELKKKVHRYILKQLHELSIFSTRAKSTK